jgi:predicted nucleic acid-binding protein
MNIILDSNVLFSALIKDSFTRKLILEYDSFFLFPAFIMEEMEKHKQELITKSMMEESAFNDLLQLILKRVLIVSNSNIIVFRDEAREIVKDIDIDDAIFIACGLAYKDSILWSDDKNLKKQTRVKVLNTGEIRTILE